VSTTEATPQGGSTWTDEQLRDAGRTLRRDTHQLLGHVLAELDRYTIDLDHWRLRKAMNLLAAADNKVDELHIAAAKANRGRNGEYPQSDRPVPSLRGQRRRS
jgi:hypothetical protein